MYLPHDSAMTHWKARLAAGACLCVSLLLALPARAQLPTLGDTSEMNSSAERKLGESIARELYRDPDYLDDPVLDEYVLGIWKRLLAAARSRRADTRAGQSFCLAGAAGQGPHRQCLCLA